MEEIIMVSVREAKDIAAKIEEIETTDNIEILLTGFRFNRDMENYLLQLSINGKHMSDYIEYKLGQIPELKGCVIKCRKTIECLEISIPSLRYMDLDSRLLEDDRLVWVDLKNKTINLSDGNKSYYESMQKLNCDRKLCELDEFWAKYQDFTFKKRVKSAFGALRGKHHKIANFFFTLFVPREKIDTRLKEELERVKEKNKHLSELNETSIKKKQFYNEHLEEHMKNFNQKKEMVKNYFLNLGYVIEEEEDGLV